MLTKKFFNSVFSCGNLLAVSCQNGTVYLVQKLTLKTMHTMESHKETRSDMVMDSTEDNLRAYVTLS